MGELLRVLIVEDSDDDDVFPQHIQRHLPRQSGRAFAVLAATGGGVTSPGAAHCAGRV